MRSLRLALAAAVVLLIASIGLIWWWTQPEPSPGPAGQRAPAEPAPQGAPEMPPASEPVSTEKPPAAAIATVRQAPLVATTGAWESIPPTPARRLPTIGHALEQVRPALAHCFDEETQARYGQRTYTSVGTPPAGAGSPIFLLNLEAGAAGALRVVDAPVEARGAAEDGLIACAQEALRGRDLGASGFSSGARLRVRYPLPPITTTAAPRTRAAPRVRLKTP